MQHYHDIVLQWILPVSLLIGGFFIGIMVKSIVFARIKKLVMLTHWQWDTIIIKALRRMIIFWFSLGGAYAGVLNLPVKMEPGNFQLISKSIVAMLIFSVTMVIARIGVDLIDLHSKKGEGIFPSTTIFSNLAKAIIYIIGVLIILQWLGISIAPILTALGVGGLAVALALQGTLSNLFSGLQIIIARQIRPGDYIQLDSGDRGHVTDINWRNTTIRNLGNNITIIPNSKMAQAVITNYNLPEKEMSIILNIGVSYDSDLEMVERVTLDVAHNVLENVEGGMPGFEPLVRYNNFNDSSIDFSLILRTSEFVNQYILKHEFIKQLHDRYKKEGITIPFPIRTVYLKNGIDQSGRE